MGFSLDNSQPPLAADALQVSVVRYNADNTGQPFELLPNVRCLRIDVKEGPEPAAAQMEYILDDSLQLNFGWPSQFEQIWPIDAKGPYVVRPDDRIVVMAQNPDGSPMYLFDGFAQIPQVDIGPQAQRVSFSAIGAAARAYDDVITGRVQRSSEKPTDTSGSSDVAIDLPCRFNPADDSIGTLGGFRGNSTPNANFTVDSGNIYGETGLGDFPVFIDPLLSEREVANQKLENPEEGAGDAGDLVAPWYISDALKYLISQPNGGDKYLDWPKFKQLDDLLNARYPPPGSDTFDPASAIKANVMIRDYDAANKPMPEVIGELLGYAGFLMYWKIGSDPQGLPRTDLKIYRRDAASTQAPKLVYLDQAKNKVDLAKNNLGQIHLARDSNSIVNAWTLETAQRQVEVSIVLAPLYQPATGDGSGANRGQFDQANLVGATALIQRKYRWYGADECGDGHLDRAGGVGGFLATAFDFSKVFLPDKDGTPSYVARYRPGSHTVVARDTKGKPFKSNLSISFDYTGETPAVWDGTGTWQSIPGGWKLMHDRLGVIVTAEKLETSWHCGDGDAYDATWDDLDPIVPGGLIHGIKWWADPPVDKPTFGKVPVLMLTTAIDDDLQMDVSADKRKASPTQFIRSRAADCQDHFQYATIHSSSINFTHAGGVAGKDAKPVVVRDDTKPAQTHANQLRAANEMPPLAGSLTIPFITTYYEIGDRIRQIKGRNIDLATNIASSQGESTTYPWIIGVSWSFENDRQQTILQITDRRAERGNMNAW